LPRDVLLDGDDNAGTTFGGHFYLKIWEGKNVQKSVLFTSIFEFANICGTSRDIDKW